MSLLPRVALGRGPNAKPALRRRLANVVSVQSDYTITVRFPGDTADVAGVRYASHVAPDPGGVVFIDTDGLDLIATASVAGNGGAWPSARTQKTSDQALTTTTATTVTYSSTVFDPWGMFDNTNDELVAPLTGFYLGSVTIVFSGLAAGNVQSCYLRSVTANGLTVNQTAVGRVVSAGTGNVWFTVTDVFPMLAGERLRVVAQSNVTTTTVGQSNESAGMSLTYLGPQA